MARGAETASNEQEAEQQQLKESSTTTAMKVNWEFHQNQKPSTQEKLLHALRKQNKTMMLLFCWT